MSKKAVSLATRRARAGDIDWNSVVMRAKEIVESYDTGVTLRQLYYRLVSEGMIPNEVNAYKHLSRKTAQARREGWFPTLIDRTRQIERYAYWASPRASMHEAVNSYRRDRTEGQEWQIYLGVEKHGMSVQLMHWFGNHGIPVLALGGYSSQTFVDEVKQHVGRDERPSVLLYAGDFDPSGVDIDRDFEERTEIFDEVHRVALARKHIDEFNLPPMPGKAKDARSASFILEHGELIQVELDALPPEELRKLYQGYIDRYWDIDTWEELQEEEAEERQRYGSLQKFLNLDAEIIGVTAVNDLKGRDEVLLVMDACIDKLVELEG